MPDAPASDADLVLRAAAGDHAAFQRLYDQYNVFIRHVLLSLAGRVDSRIALVSDAQQLVWLMLLEGRWRIDPERTPSTLHAFLKTICRYAFWHTLVDARVISHAEPLPDDEEADLIGAFTDPRPTPLARVLNAEDLARAAARRDVIRGVLASLSDRQRAMVRLRYRDGLTYDAIGLQLNCTASAVCMQLRKIRRRLGEALGVERLPRDRTAQRQHGLTHPQWKVNVRRKATKRRERARRAKLAIAMKGAA